MPFEPPYISTPAIESLCIQIGELVGRISPSAPLATSVRLHRELRIASVHSSLVIEGNRLTAGQVTALLDGRRVLGPAEDIREARNAKRAYDLIGTFDPASEADLLRAHGIMMEGLIPDAGRLRSGNVGVFDGDEVIHMGALADVVPEVLRGLLEWLGATPMHPLVASCLFHCELELIHPFSDGNGRIGRLWQTAILASWRRELQWLPVESIILDRQEAYYASLAEAGRSGSDEPFVEFMLTAVRDALVPYAEGGAGIDDAEADDGAALPAKDAEDGMTLSSRNAGAALPSRADRANAALRYFSEHEDGTVAGLARATGLSKRTAERLVAELKDEGLLRHVGPTRGGRWCIRDDKRW